MPGHGFQEKPQYQGQIMSDLPDCVLWWDDWLRKQKPVSKALNTLSHSTIVLKLGRPERDGWTTKLVKKIYLGFPNERIKANSLNWSPVMSDIFLVLDKGADTVIFIIACMMEQWTHGKYTNDQRGERK